MSKRSSETQLPPRRPRPTSGVLYLYQQLRELDTAESPFIVDADDENIAKWSVGLSSGALREKLDLMPLADALDGWARASRRPPVIVMDIRFPRDYPTSVPFVRMVRPRFAFHTGHVTIGGSMCTELLTPSGWSPMTVHALLLTICQMLREGGAKIQMRSDLHHPIPFADYSEEEARDAYKRVAEFHGWSTANSK